MRAHLEGKAMTVIASRLVSRGTTARQSTLIAAAAAAGLTLSVGAGVADAAPTPLRVDQAPNVGITVDDNGISGGFAADLTAVAADGERTRLALRPFAEACADSLATARVAITWRNVNTNRTDDVTFPVCAAGKPSSGAVVSTGIGRISFTTTIIGRAEQAFTISPGTGWFIR